jgi:hypothetical protein
MCDHTIIMPSFLELAIPSLIAALAYIGVSQTDHTIVITVAMCGALGGFFMLYFFSVMEKYPIVVQPQVAPQQQPTLEQLFGPEEVQQQPQEVSADSIPLVQEQKQQQQQQQEPLPRKRKIVIREYFEESTPKRPRSARELEQKIHVQIEKATQARSKPPTRRTPMERCRIATLPLLQNLLADLQADPTKEHDIARQVEELLI